MAEEVPVASGDYHGDGKSDLVVYKPKTRLFLIDYNGNGFSLKGQADIQCLFGDFGGIPPSGDFDGDGKPDLVVYRPKTKQFLIGYSGNGFKLDGHPDVEISR